MASERTNVYISSDDKNNQSLFKEPQENDQLQTDLVRWSAKRERKEKEFQMQRVINKWQQIIGQRPKKDVYLDLGLRKIDWVQSIKRLDPRFQIRCYFEEVSRHGGPLDDPLIEPPLEIISGFAKASAFSVWRPTSNDAISKMMKGEATGKGLEVKGKSAKCGDLSGLIPFVQIYKEEHKLPSRLGLTSHGRMRIYYKTKELRDKAVKQLKMVAKGMAIAVDVAIRKLEQHSCREQTSFDGESNKKVSAKLFSNDDDDELIIISNDLKATWSVDDWKIYKNKNNFGLDVSERVFFEACIMGQDIGRKGSMETGRPSEPNFQSMNFASTRKYSGVGPRTVVYQVSENDPLKPQTFVVAYEENGSVAPVASDFDCFLVGTRGVVFDEPMATEQVELMKWMNDRVGDILAKNKPDVSWTSRWFDVLTAADDSAMPEMPRFGFGDPKSYKIMEGAVARFVHNKNGAVRHGAECFNYKFPQDIDDKLLVIADIGDFPGSNAPFKYMSPGELQELMLTKIDDGFIFPLNPKWILADRGWKRVYDKMMSRQAMDPKVEISLETWYPKSSGVREQIEVIYSRYPDGFVDDDGGVKMEGTEALDLATQKLARMRLLRGGVSKVMRALSISKLSSSTSSSLTNAHHDNNLTTTGFFNDASILNVETENKIHGKKQSMSQVSTVDGSDSSSKQMMASHTSDREKDHHVFSHRTPLSDDVSISSLDYSIDIGSSLSKDALYQLRMDARKKLMSSFLDPDEQVDSDDDLSFSKQTTPRQRSRKSFGLFKRHHNTRR
jgi:hypothetical protein